MGIVLTTQGIAFLYERPVAGLPFQTPYSQATIFPGIWTDVDVIAALLIYRQWLEKEGELGNHWIDHVEAAEAGHPAILANIERFTRYQALVDAVLQAIADHTDLPRWVLPAGDPIADELAQLLNTMAPFPSDLLDEGGDWFKQRLAEYRASFERSIADWRGTLEVHQRLSDQVLVLLQTQPLAEPPFAYAVHDGQHILDQPECWTIGADREKACIWLN